MQWRGYLRFYFGKAYKPRSPPTIHGQVYTPYTCIAFDITPSGTATTDIEHIVALAEAHDSGIAADRRRTFAADIDNLTIADPTVNRSQKSAKDAAEWRPTRHGAWFAERVIQVKLEYGLTIDPAERDALKGTAREWRCTIELRRLRARPPAHRSHQVELPRLTDHRPAIPRLMHSRTTPASLPTPCGATTCSAIIPLGRSVPDEH